MNKLSLISLFLLSSTWHVGADNVIMLEAQYGCIGRQDDGSNSLLLKECNPNDDTVLWTRDSNKFHSYIDHSECIQVGAETMLRAQSGTSALKRGSAVYSKPCGGEAAFQTFDSSWEGGPLTLQERPDLCMIHFGAEPVVGESRIMMVPCDELGGLRAAGWSPTPVEFDYVLLDSMPGSLQGGCIGRKDESSDELIYKACRSDDETLQWRLDDRGRMRSRVNDTECMQADAQPTGVDSLGRRTRMYAKACAKAGSQAESFQVFKVFNGTWIDNGAKGPLALESRPDLCVVHFGAEPTLGESHIMLAECDSLGGPRAKGWEATDPCAAPPTCDDRTFLLTPEDVPDSAVVVVNPSNIADVQVTYSYRWENRDTESGPMIIMWP